MIDRNLYERTCDVRWWATDGSLVDALADPTPERTAFASQRMGVILDAYTVYHDLVLCDTHGEVVANGRPNDFRSKGKKRRTDPWFRQAVTSASGDEYGFESAHNSELVNGEPALAYSCAVRRDGRAHGKVLGVLGVLFNWAGLANPIFESIPVDPSERDLTDSFIIDSSGCVMASSLDYAIGERLAIPGLSKVMDSPKGYFLSKWKGDRVCVGHARAPGFETYSTGWYSLILQRWSDI